MRTGCARTTLALLGGLSFGGPSRADPPPPSGTEVIVAPYDPAHPDRPTRAILEFPPAVQPPPAPPPRPSVPADYTGQVEHSTDDLENPFAAAREKAIASAAAAAPPVDDRFVPAGPMRTPNLHLPPERACLPAAGGDGIEGAGLSAPQIQGAIAGFLPTAAICVPPGTRGAFRVVASFDVACSGRVQKVEITDNGGFPPAVTECLANALRYVPFPAHDRVGGEMFDMPMKFGN